jgi:hypothetical protein
VEGHGVGARLRPGRRPHPAVSDDDARHAALHLEAHLGVDHGREVVVCVDVDEARREREPAAVDAHAAAREGWRDRGDAVAAHGEVGARGRRAGAVVERRAVDHEVVRQQPPCPLAA